MYFILFSCIKSRYVYKHIFNKFFFYFLAEFVGLNQFFFFAYIFMLVLHVTSAMPNRGAGGRGGRRGGQVSARRGRGMTKSRCARPLSFSM